ncbi:MAG TPA: hypothetical protein VGR57_19500 [Ktedonobacterales bacterium]|nr:hypothetical protein [Ktedonobacterales bacterium]
MSEMSNEAEIYTTVLRRLAERDHGWGKPYLFAAFYVLDRAVPGVEVTGVDTDDTTIGRPLDETLKTTLRGRLIDLPSVKFVRTFSECYDATRQGPIQVQDGGAFVALGPISEESGSAIVGALFYCGHRWARWMRYHLEQRGGIWQITESDTLAVS